MTVRHIFEISEDDHPPTPSNAVGHPRPRSLMTLDFANAFVSPGVNSWAELVPSAYTRNARGQNYARIEILRQVS
jgi:hypothetical protein